MGLRFTTYIGDGDGTGFPVCAAQTYEPGITVSKMDCVGHVEKKVGKNLKDLKNDLRSKKLADRVTIRRRDNSQTT